MANETTIICEKTTGNFKLAAVKRTFENGRVTFGLAIAKKGRKGWDIGWGYDESQARRLVRVHNAAQHDPSILYYGG